VGDVVTFLGRDEGALLSVDEIATAGGFSPYELLTGLRARLPRTYTGIADS
jgi:alanine racemase